MAVAVAVVQLPRLHHPPTRVTTADRSSSLDATHASAARPGISEVAVAVVVVVTIAEVPVVTIAVVVVTIAVVVVVTIAVVVTIVVVVVTIAVGHPTNAARHPRVQDLRRGALVLAPVCGRGPAAMTVAATTAHAGMPTEAATATERRMQAAGATSAASATVATTGMADVTTIVVTAVIAVTIATTTETGVTAVITVTAGTPVTVVTVVITVTVAITVTAGTTETTVIAGVVRAVGGVESLLLGTLRKNGVVVHPTCNFSASPHSSNQQGASTYLHRAPQSARTLRKQPTRAANGAYVLGELPWMRNNFRTCAFSLPIPARPTPRQQLCLRARSAWAGMSGAGHAKNCSAVCRVWLRDDA